MNMAVDSIQQIRQADLHKSKEEKAYLVGQLIYRPTMYDLMSQHEELEEIMSGTDEKNL
jgi:hypothetical protein